MNEIRYAIRQIPDLGYYIVKYRGLSIEPESIEPAKDQYYPVNDLRSLGIKEFVVEECQIHTIGHMTFPDQGGVPNET